MEKLANAIDGDDLLRNTLIFRGKLPGSPARFSESFKSLSSSIQSALKKQGIHALYAHQAEALQRIESGKNVVVVTPTASGKSLTYILPVLREIERDPDSSALLLFPLKALEQDQAAKLRLWQEYLHDNPLFTLGIFDGDTPSKERQRIKKLPPNFLISNPDMLHQGMLAYHQSWEKFFKRLKYIVIDELHAYRGVFGSHILQVFRRLRRLLHYYGAHPQFICLSATVANPEEFARDLTGAEIEVISDSGAPIPERDFWMMNAPEMSMTNAVTRSLIHALDYGLKTIVFTKSRVATEIIYRSLTDSRPDLARRVSSYRAGFLPEERRDIEQNLSSGKLDGVISTSALELGIDIGGLDLCILAGYPGSMMSLWQRAGRVGRRGAPSGVMLITGTDQLDQFFARNVDELLNRPLERALVNQQNDHILRQHLPAAAAEMPLMFGDPYIDVQRYQSAIAALEQERALLPSASGKQWFPGKPRPHAQVDLRNVGGTFDIVDVSRKNETVIGTVSGNSAFRECHDGAIYLHRGEAYQVESLDLRRKIASVKPYRGNVYTMIRTQKETEILDVRQTRTVKSFVARLGLLKVTEHFVAYERRRVYTQELLSVEPLELPPQSFQTVGCWIELPSTLQGKLGELEFHHMGSIHAMEHATISLTPLLALCDRNDLGGISFTKHPQLPNGAVFFYDGYPGGVGIAECMYYSFEDLLARTLKLIETCPCEEGCPSCIQSPKCGSGNRPLDKNGARFTLSYLTGDPESEPLPQEIVAADNLPRKSLDEPYEPFEIPSDKRVLVFDLETQLSAEEVGGWREARQMRVAVAVVWDSIENKFSSYEEAEIEALFEHLKRADVICGFNIRKFDFEVLRGYTFENLHALPILDLLEVVTENRGGRLKLDTIARATLGVGKSADGLQSLEWFKSGQIGLVREYCQKDVEVTRDVLKFALKHGYVLFEDKSGASVKLPMKLTPEMLAPMPESSK
ncbi:MAG: DEAD/DEAH box helicase [Calditrichaeota bacterium]|nr:DEAD/DEAH box helicase [Calditrichota bacterium]